MSHRPLTALCLVLGLLAAPSLAAADPRIAVLPFRGPHAEDAREMAHDALSETDGARVAPLRRTDRAIEGSRGARARRLAARRLGADYFVTGRVRTRGRRARVALVVEDRGGRTVARRTVRVVNGRGNFGAAARRLVSRLDPPREREAPNPFRPAEESDDEEERDHARARDDDGRRGAPLVDIHVGARVQGRLASFETTEGNVHRNDVAYPVLTALVRARPWRNEDDVHRGIEMRGFFGHAVGLRSRNTLTDEPVDTSFFNVYADVGILFEVDPSAELGLGLGFGWDSFAFGEQSLVVVPSAEYAYLRPHLRGRFRLEDELLVLGLGVAYRGVLSRGALSEHFGQDGETQGFDVAGRLGGSLDLGGVGLSYGIEAGVAGYFHFFDGEAITAQAKSGTDFSLWLGAQAGFAFR